MEPTYEQLKDACVAALLEIRWYQKTFNRHDYTIAVERLERCVTPEELAQAEGKSVVSSSL